MYPAPLNFLRLDDGSEFVKGSSFMELIEILPPCWVHGGKNMKKTVCSYSRDSHPPKQNKVPPWNSR